MAVMDDIRQKWQESFTAKNDFDPPSVDDSAAKPTTACLDGYRSICWKTYLLSQKELSGNWIQFLRDGRIQYGKARDNFLKFIKHPEALNSLSIDPLADVADSPWNAVREDEIIITEIKQDVQRLPEEANYHDENVQSLILDVLFIYCKSNPTGGGYRQGMHELLAPIVHVLTQDALVRSTLGAVSAQDETMVEMLDSQYIEHDAYILFAKLMTRAQMFYEVAESAEPSANPQSLLSQESRSAIVERSKFIHEVCLNKVDPELSAHLTNIEILPQIFLIRWIRLLFSREFPFQQVLTLWDKIFALDPSLRSIDLICVAMLIRIRWHLLEADYSVCLQLLLKYPHSDDFEGPESFVDDAIYLRDHMNVDGGSTLIKKYTGKAPQPPKTPVGSRPNTPTFARFSSFRQRGLGVKSPLAASTRYLQEQGGVEALFQGAAKGAKGLLERGEKLGVNQAVRDAVGEIRRNMSNFNEARYVAQVPRTSVADEPAEQTLLAMEARNRELASMLHETVESLKTLSASAFEDKAKSHELVEIAAAKVQFVKIYLEDSTMKLPRDDRLTEDGTDGDGKEGNLPDPDSFDIEDENGDTTPLEDTDVPKLDITTTLNTQKSDSSKLNTKAAAGVSQKETEAQAGKDENAQVAQVASKTRPSAPIPTRSTLAQSSFSWMLEPDETSPTLSSAKASKSPPPPQKKRNNASREKNAFLFGDVGTESEGRDSLGDDIFGLEPLRKNKGPFE